MLEQDWRTDFTDRRIEPLSLSVGPDVMTICVARTPIIARPEQTMPPHGQGGGSPEGDKRNDPAVGLGERQDAQHSHREAPQVQGPFVPLLNENQGVSIWP
jgi:hypothetical protein